MKIALFLNIILLLSTFSFSQSNYTPPQGYVPDQETAKKIAEAIWLPIYGKSVLNEKPYDAQLIGDSVWVVSGSLPGKTHISGDTVFVIEGGVALIEIRKKDCKVLKVIHGK